VQAHRPIEYDRIARLGSHQAAAAEIVWLQKLLLDLGEALLDLCLARLVQVDQPDRP